MSESAALFNSLLPWNFITKHHEGVVVQKNGNLQRSFEYRAPDIDSSGAEEVNTLALRVNDFAKHFSSEAGWAFHLEARRSQIQEYPRLVFDTLAPYLVDRERETIFKAAGRHFESVYFLTITWKPPSESLKKLTSMFVRNASNENESSGLKENVEFFVNSTNSFIGLLSGDLFIRPLDNEETVMYLHSTVSDNLHPIRYKKTDILLDRILVDCGLENSMPMKLGDKYIPIVTINDFPDETYPAILDGLNRARLEYRWVTRYIPLAKEEGLKEAKKKEKHHRGSRETILQTIAKHASGEAPKAVNHGASVKENDAVDAGLEIDSDAASLGYLTTGVTVWDSNINTALKKADYVKTVIQRQGFTCFYDKYNALESFKASLPGNVYSSYRALPVMSNSMSHVVPLSSVWAGFSFNSHAYEVTGAGAPHVICSTIEGTPFFLNLNVGDVGHSAIWGPTGAGKSTLLNLLEIQAFKYPGSLVIVFDKGRSCRQTCLAAGGLFFEPAAENSAGVNFQPFRDLETNKDVLDAVDFVETCIAVNGEKITPVMSKAVKDAVESMSEIPFERRTFTTFIQDANSRYQDPVSGKPVFRDLLADYTVGGKYGSIFDSDSSGLSTDTRFLAIEMEALMNRGESCVAPALVYLFNLVEKKFDGRLAFLILDEAWLFLKNEIFADKITEWLKVLRKKNVYVIFATQEVSDIAKSPLKSTVIQQCMTKIYLADPQALNILDAYREFGLTDSEISLISQAKMKRDYFYTSPNGHRLFQLDLENSLTLSLIGAPSHSLLDELTSIYEPGSRLCDKILSTMFVNYKYLLENGYPSDPEPVPRLNAPPPDDFSYSLADAVPEASNVPDESPQPSSVIVKNDEFLNAVASLPERKKNDGSGRAADAVSKRFNVSLSVVYQAKSVLKHGDQTTIEALRRGDISVKTAYKMTKKESVKLESELNAS